MLAIARKAKRGLNRAKDKARQRKHLVTARRRLANLPDGEYFVTPGPSGHIVQWASSSLVSDILDGKVKAADDPKQRGFGFKTKADYEFWSWRNCGLMCVKAVMDSYDAASNETVASLTKKGADLGGYKAREDKGWFYGPLIKLAKRYGLAGQIHGALAPEEIAAGVLDNHFMIASVHPGVIRGDLDKNPHDGKGHLVLVHGFRMNGHAISGFFIDNPSGRVAATQKGAFIPIDHFREAFAGRGFSLWRP